VIGIGRNPARCREAEQQIRAAVPGARVGFCLADFSRLADVRAVVPQVRETLAGWGASCLDALVNNAGVVSPTYVRTEDGLELTVAVTHFAHFLLTHELLPELQAAPLGRVITVSSNNHRLAWLKLAWLNRPPLYFILWAYANAKLCNVLFTYEFNRRFAGTRMRAFALDPGLVDTGIGQKSSSGLVDWVWGLRRRGGASPELPADGILHLAANPELQQATEYYWLRTRQPKPPSRQAQDEKAAAELWALSEDLCRVSG
jgi:NAD(P)-dependent dehydrogenase (short-subunit alcohol dehydrogenase family)